jgi:DNA-binding CsgD family transcriptional regulator
VRIGSTHLLFRNPQALSGLGTTALGEEGIPPVELTAAQRRVLVALCRSCRADFGHPATNQEIAAELVYSIDGVKTHLRTLFRKFAIGEIPQNQKRLQLVERALRSGTVTERDYRP